MNTPIKIGDTVRIKSELNRAYDATVMTVERLRGDGRVVCVWFDRRRTLCRAVFTADALVVS